MRVFHSRSGRSLAGLRVGLLGGSFNPAHAGHVAISLYALKRLKLDQIWWLVSPQNPLKPNRGMASLQQRLQKAYALAAPHARILVTDIEAQVGTLYTVDTIMVLKKYFPSTHFVWLMGADNLNQMPRWKNWADIFIAVPVAVFRRPGYAAGRRKGKVSLRFDGAWVPVHQGHQLANRKAPAWVLLDNPLNNLSATAIRREGNELIRKE